MKRITGLPDAPEGLRRFVADTATVKTWNEFRAFEAGAARQELAHALVEQQHGLCAYCEIKLVPTDTRVEHFVPQSDPDHGAAQAVAHGNLMAVCMGGSNANFGPDAIKPDPARFLRPVKKNLSCDAAKAETASDSFIDPRVTLDLPSLFSVDDNGVISADPTVCANHGVSDAVVEQHITGLGLNVGRLRNQRAAVRAALSDAYEFFTSLPPNDMRTHLMVLAERRLLPNQDNRIAPFFTTTRSFFGPMAERILAQPPRAWI